MKTLVIAAVLALAWLGGGAERAPAAACSGAAWCGWHQVKVNGVLTACHQYNCRTHGKIEHSESH